MTELLTASGKQYARYIFLATKKIPKIPLIGKWLSKWSGALMMAAIYVYILKEGEKENGRRKREVSRMRRGVSEGRRSTPGEVREVRIRHQGVFGDGSVDQSNNQAQPTNEEKQESFG